MATFKEAFKEARKKYGAGKTFTWKGKSYSTNLAEEEAKPAPTKKTTPKTSPRPRARPASKDVMEGYREGDIKTSSLDKPVGQNGRGDGSAEMIRRSAETALSRVEAQGSKPAAKPTTSGKYPKTDNAAILAARKIREVFSGSGGLSDSRKPSVSSTAPKQPTSPATTPSITRKMTAAEKKRMEELAKKNRDSGRR